MLVWVLTLWSMTVAPFEGGQYQTHERCMRAAKHQVVGLRKLYGPLKSKCELTRP